MTTFESSEELFIRAQRVIPGGVHSPVRAFKGLHTTPRFITKGKGAFLYDEEGKDYIDFCMSFGPLILGHRDPDVEASLHQALENGWTFGAAEKLSLELAELITSRICFLDQIRFVNSGTEAVMTAVRLARGATGRSKILKFSGCYHGHLDSMLIKAGSGLAEMSEASSKGITQQTTENTLVCELGDLGEVEALFKKHPHEIAAIFLEPLPANNGLLPQDISFLKGLRELCDRYGSLLVFDEVISGFRVHFGGMACETGIHPDLVTYGKVIGGGLPVGAVAGPKKYMELLAPAGPVYQAGTLSANPLAMTAGMATIQKLTPKFYQQLEKNTQQVCQIFSEWMQENGFEDYRFEKRCGLFWPLPLGAHAEFPRSLDQLPENLTERFYPLFETLLNKGILFGPFCL